MISLVKVWLFPYLRSEGPVGCLDQRSRVDVLGRNIYKKMTDHGHPVTEMGWIGRHRTVYVI